MAERGRQPGFKMPEEHRSKIANSQVLNRLVDHVEGKCELSATQVAAGLGLLKKCLADLSAVTIEGGENPIRTEDTGIAKLAAAIDAIASRAVGLPDPE